MGVWRQPAATAGGEAAGKDAAEKDKGKSKSHNFDLTQVGGSYVLAVEPFDAESHDMARVVGAVFRRIDEDKVSTKLKKRVSKLCQ